MEEYIRQHQNKVAQYITKISLLDLCEGSERAPGAQVGMGWWYQTGLDLARDWEAAAGAAAAEGDKGEEGEE